MTLYNFRSDGTINDPTAFDRLFNKTVELKNGCIVFTGCLHRNDYGKIRYLGRTELTHRLAYLLCVADIPDGMWVLHTCDDPACVNPEHLFLGTPQDNVDDMITKKRNAIGIESPNAKLVEQDVIRIKEMHRDGISLADISEEFNVGKPQLCRIIKGQRWAHVVI